MKSRKNFARWALVVLGMVLLTAGILRGEMRSVLNKAIYICLECIGIG